VRADLEIWQIAVEHLIRAAETGSLAVLPKIYATCSLYRLVTTQPSQFDLSAGPWGDT
jgi:hypothetical protein